MNGDVARGAEEQRQLLVATIRHTAEWRKQKAYEFGEDPLARKVSLRAKQALRVLANFVEDLPDDDPELVLNALRRLESASGRLVLTPDSQALLSRFGMGKGSWQAGQPTERQMRNLLRRLDGIEARERAARKAGYGEE